MDTSHNWLAFSLTHQPHLFEAFSSSPHYAAAEECSGGDGGVELGMMADVGPKLEDFLGGCEEPIGSPDVLGGRNYVSDLKNIEAGFLSGAPVEAPALAEPRKSGDTFGQRTSIYRGVTKHRWTGRYEAHLWDNSCRREGQSRKGRQVYLGGYDKEEKAARAYDLAALKYWGLSTTTNFPVSNYETEMEEMQNMTRQEFVASIRRKSSGFSRGASIYRGVTRHHQHGRWQARIGRVAGNKDLYLGTFSTQEEAAEAYDIAAIKFRGLNAVTNFDMSRYDLKSIASSNLPIGAMSGKTSKPLDTSSSSSSEAICIEAKQHQIDSRDASCVSSLLGFSALPVKQDHDNWSTLLALHQQQQYANNVISSGMSLDFSGAAGVGQENDVNLVWSNGILQQQQKHEQSLGNNISSIPYATPIGFGSNYDGSSNLGTWVAPASSSYYYQATKPLFQTSIYEME